MVKIKIKKDIEELQLTWFGWRLGCYNSPKRIGITIILQLASGPGYKLNCNLKTLNNHALLYKLVYLADQAPAWQPFNFASNMLS